MTSPRLLLAAGSVAATLAGIVPVLSHGPAAAQALQVSAAGVTVSGAQLVAGRSYDTQVLVPAGATSLAGAASGSPALAARVRVVLTRSSDGAILFTGSLATFRSLPVVAGTALALRVQKPAGFDGLRAVARLRWA